MKTHFIAIGGSAMHNLALALHNKGYQVTGSDDAIFEPSKSRLYKKGMLPEHLGWFPEKITTQLDAIILGMHAKADNPELIKAQELGLKIYSYPEFLYEQSKTKTRQVPLASLLGRTICVCRRAATTICRPMRVSRPTNCKSKSRRVPNPARAASCRATKSRNTLANCATRCPAWA